MATVPQVILTVTPSGSLAMELPGANGSRRQVILATNPVSAIAAIMQVLQGQARQQSTIGLDGAPTQQQSDHWYKHPIWRDPSCPFCQQELRQKLLADQFTGRERRQRQPSRKIIAEHGSGSDSVRIQRITTGKRGPGAPAISSKTADELGL